MTGPCSRIVWHLSRTDMNPFRNIGFVIPSICNPTLAKEASKKFGEWYVASLSKACKSIYVIGLFAKKPTEKVLSTEPPAIEPGTAAHATGSPTSVTAEAWVLDVQCFSQPHVAVHT